MNLEDLVFLYMSCEGEKGKNGSHSVSGQNEVMLTQGEKKVYY